MAEAGVVSKVSLTGKHHVKLRCDNVTWDLTDGGGSVDANDEPRVVVLEGIAAVPSGQVFVVQCKATWTKSVRQELAKNRMVRPRCASGGSCLVRPRKI